MHGSLFSAPALPIGRSLFYFSLQNQIDDKKNYIKDRGD